MYIHGTSYTLKNTNCIQYAINQLWSFHISAYIYIHTYSERGKESRVLELPDFWHLLKTDCFASFVVLFTFFFFFQLHEDNSKMQLQPPQTK